MAKILMFSHGPLPDIRIDRETKALTEEGHEVAIICANKRSGEISSYYKEVHYIPLNRKQKAFLFFSLRKAKIKYKEIIKAYKPDILHAHDLVAANIAFRIKQKSMKFIYEDHEVWELIKKLELFHRKGILKFPIRIYQYLASKFLTKKIMKKSDLVVVVQEHWREFYAKKGININKIISIENFASFDIIDEALKRTDLVDDFIKSDPRKKMIHSSRHSKASKEFLRDISKFVLAAKELEDWVLIIIGPEDEKFVNQGVKFLESRPMINYLSCVAHCDVALNPLLLNERLHYCSPNRLFENAALGVRVISTKANVFYEKFNDLLIWYDPNSTKDEIINILQNIDKYPTGQEIREFSKKFKWENEVKKLIEKYNEL